MLRVALATVLLAAAVPCSPPQDDVSKPAQPEIRGTVTEVGTNVPVPGVEVEIFRWPDNEPRLHGSGLKRDGLATFHTDPSGVFQARVEKFGDYSVEIKKDGWGAGGSFMRGFKTSVDVSLTKDHPRRELTFQMSRAAELAGRVVDVETGKPVANLRVSAAHAEYSGRQRIAWPSESSATTDAEGRFVITGLMPADYVVQIRRTEGSESGLRKQFSKKDVETVEHGYQESYWPGGSDMSVAAPVAVGSGAHVSVGEIEARKAPLYRIHGSLAASGCAPGEKVGLGQVIRHGGAEDHRSLGQLTCGQEFLVVGKEPGTYWLEAWVDTPDRYVTGSVPVTIVDKNVETAIALAPGVAVDARFSVTEGSRKPDFQSIKLSLRAIGGSGRLSDVPPQTDADGRVHFASRPVRDYDVWVSGVPKSFYVEELRYNSSPLAGKLLLLNGEAMAHNLEIVLDDKPASLSGTVGDSEHRVGKAYIMLVKCPLSDAAYQAAARAAADDDGKFQIAGLAPGTYRVFAVEPQIAYSLANFNILDRLLSGGKEITLGPNGYQELTLDVADPRR